MAIRLPAAGTPITDRLKEVEKSHEGGKAGQPVATTGEGQQRAGYAHDPEAIVKAQREQAALRDERLAEELERERQKEAAGKAGQASSGERGKS